jgi:Protein of unknown function (DUF2800)
LHWNKYSQLEGLHSFLSPSSYHWINYDEDRLVQRYKTLQAAKEGTEQHVYAATCIKERIIQDNETTTLGMYINQCIQYRMTSEQLLFFSPNCFGTADAISFRHRRLRISDLKTGETKTSEHQLEVYAAIFCLEYKKDPHELREIELRIYQDGRCRVYVADPAFITFIMEKIIVFDKKLNELREEVTK